mmetsp:Transcript_13653/g.31191  ORF Transcript_13653/g.31191 Transcript_13653/m.31191 type:complete len:207 (+) Transcript_13653:100-720(+)
MVADGGRHLSNAVLGALEAPLLENRPLHFEGDAPQPPKEDASLEAGVPGALLHPLLEPLGPVGLGELVYQLAGHALRQLHVPLQRLRRLHRLRSGLPVGDRMPSGARVVLDLLLSVPAEDAGLEGLAQHVLRLLRVLRPCGAYPLALALAVLEDRPSIGTVLRDVLQLRQGVLGVAEAAHALLSQGLPVPRLVIVLVNLERGLDGL